MHKTIMLPFPFWNVNVTVRWMFSTIRSKAFHKGFWPFHERFSGLKRSETFMFQNWKINWKVWSQKFFRSEWNFIVNQNFYKIIEFELIFKNLILTICIIILFANTLKLQWFFRFWRILSFSWTWKFSPVAESFPTSHKCFRPFVTF